MGQRDGTWRTTRHNVFSNKLEFLQHFSHQNGQLAVSVGVPRAFNEILRATGDTRLEWSLEITGCFGRGGGSFGAVHLMGTGSEKSEKEEKVGRSGESHGYLLPVNGVGVIGKVFHPIVGALNDSLRVTLLVDTTVVVDCLVEIAVIDGVSDEEDSFVAASAFS